MSMKEKIMGIFGKALDEAMPEDTPPAGAQDGDVAAALAAIMARLDAIEAAMKPAGDGDTPPADEPPPADGDVPPADGDTPPADQPPADADPVEQRLANIEAALAKLLGIEEGEGEGMDGKTGDKAAMCQDAETVARAEILAPGIAKTADCAHKALAVCYGTEEGKAVIDGLLSGKSFDAADKDMLFVAASELMKGVRRSQFPTRVSLDSLPGMKAGEMTPERINALNAERYGKK